jgi:hypothetical protein
LRHGSGEPTIKKNIDLDQHSEYAEKPQHPPRREPPPNITQRRHETKPGRRKRKGSPTKKSWNRTAPKG